MYNCECCFQLDEMTLEEDPFYGKDLFIQYEIPILVSLLRHHICKQRQVLYQPGTDKAGQ